MTKPLYLQILASFLLFPFGGFFFRNFVGAVWTLADATCPSPVGTKANLLDLIIKGSIFSPCGNIEAKKKRKKGLDV